MSYNIKNQIQALKDRAAELLEKSKAGTLTVDEAIEAERVPADAKALMERLASQQKSAEIMSAFTFADDEVHGGDVGSGRGFGDGFGGGFAGDAKSGHLSLAGLATSITAGMKAYSDRVSPGVKALVPAGETIVSIPVVNADPIAGGVSQERPPRLLDLIPAVRRAAVYDVLKQTGVATPGAASVVAPGAVKPVKKLGLHKEQDRLRVVAVLSEPIDKFTLEDASNLRTWVGAELADAIEEALELEILTGDGTGEHLTGLANTSGIQTQAYATDRITTIAAGLAKLTNLGITPRFIALSAADALALQTTRNASGAFDLGGAIDPAASKAWGTTFSVVPGLDAGDGWIVGDQTVELAHDGGGVRVEWGTPGDTWTRNQVQARVEGRFNLDVLRPHGVVRMALTGA